MRTKIPPVAEIVSARKGSQQNNLLDLVTRLRMAVVPFARELQRRLSSDYSPTELSVLGAIDRDGPVRLSELALRERLSLPRVSTVVAGLEAAGVVQRFDDANDRRVSLVRVSESGERWIAQARSERDAWLAERIAALSPTEQAAVEVAVAVLEQLGDG